MLETDKREKAAEGTFKRMDGHVPDEMYRRLKEMC